MEPVDLTNDILPTPEIRIYESIGTAWSIKVLSSEKTDPLGVGSKFRYKDHIYQIGYIERFRSTPVDYYNYGCKQVGKVE
jgi:hypothetical protein